MKNKKISKRTGIIFLHGWGTSGGVFVRQLEFLKHGFSVIAPDIYELGAFSEDISAVRIAEYIRRCGYNKIFIVGWSLGGAIALKLQKLLADITCGTVFCGFCPVFVRNDVNPHGIHPAAFTKLRKRLERSAEDAIEKFSELVLYGNLNNIDNQVFKKIVMSDTSENKRAGLLNSISVLERGDFSDDAMGVTGKTLVIHGALDKLCTVEAAAGLSKLLGDSRVEVIPGAPHAPFFTHHVQFNNILKDFLWVES